MVNPGSAEFQHDDMEHIRKDAKILCVCWHGSTRSKYIARALDEMGYPNAHVLSVMQLKKNQTASESSIREHDLVVCASDTEYYEIRYFLKTHGIDDLHKVLNLHLGQDIHARLHVSLFEGGHRAEDDVSKSIEELKTSLSAVGF
ncbi:MAG TPA: rhodanese-like domain-containing protein [Patescibacteria group bacterium]|nr:rhodanese-like domain-containing protein [Patescibacteria group bacterium]